MRVLIFGDCNSIWVKNVIQHTLLKYNDSVYVISPEPVCKFAEFYNQNSIVVTFLKSYKYNFILRLKNHFSLNKIFKNNNYDIFCVHYVNDSGLRLVPLAKKYCKKVILIFWGSDILRENAVKSLWIDSFEKADDICICTTEIRDKFNLLYGHYFDNKFRDIHFGVNGLEELSGLDFDSRLIKKKYIIDDNKIIISIGYNKSKGQQHTEVLKSLMNLSLEDRNKIHLLLRLTYGNEDLEYLKIVKTLVFQTGCSFNIFEEYLPDRESAELTYITDIFVHSQITDARSSTLIEHLYAKCLVLNPEWIHYSELEDRLFYLIYKDFNELSDYLKDNLVPKIQSNYIDYLNKNSEIISNSFSWEYFSREWRETYLN